MRKQADTNNLFPDLQEVQELDYLKEVGHIEIQILTGHGAFAEYLHKHNKLPTNLCEDCGEVDHATHAVMEYPAHEDVREDLANSITAARVELPWSLGSVLRREETTVKLMAA